VARYVHDNDGNRRTELGCLAQEYSDEGKACETFGTVEDSSETTAKNQIKTPPPKIKKARRK
jgi:hypothetical protein